jgi:hypothetical protein
VLLPHQRVMLRWASVKTERRHVQQIDRVRQVTYQRRGQPEGCKIHAGDRRVLGVPARTSRHPSTLNWLLALAVPVPSPAACCRTRIFAARLHGFFVRASSIHSSVHVTKPRQRWQGGRNRPASRVVPRGWRRGASYPGLGWVVEPRPAQATNFPPGRAGSSITRPPAET